MRRTVSGEAPEQRPWVIKREDCRVVFAQVLDSDG